MPILTSASGGLVVANSNIIVARSAMLSLLTALKAVDKPLDGAKVHLFTDAGLTPTEDTVVGSFTEPDYAAYAAQTAVWGTPLSLADGTGVLLAPALTFGVANATEATTVYGAFVTDTAGTVLLYSELFPNPYAMVDETRDLVYIPAFPLALA